MNPYRPLLNVYVIWHPNADALYGTLAQAIYTCLNRNRDKPFARGIGIPTYYRSVCEPGKKIPSAIDLNAAVYTVIIVLVDDHLVLAEPCSNYIADLYKKFKPAEDSIC